MKVVHVGFTGTREPINSFQSEWLKHWLIEFALTQKETPSWLHHGGCIGADTAAHHAGRDLGYMIHLHPPLNTFAQGIFPEDCDKSDEPYSFSGRNQRIVKACDVLIACPLRARGHGGTWNTVQHAIDMKKPHVIIFRDRVEINGDLK